MVEWFIGSSGSLVCMVLCFEWFIGLDHVHWFGLDGSLVRVVHWFGWFDWFEWFNHVHWFGWFTGSSGSLVPVVH